MCRALGERSPHRPDPHTCSPWAGASSLPPCALVDPSCLRALPLGGEGPTGWEEHGPWHWGWAAPAWPRSTLGGEGESAGRRQASPPARAGRGQCSTRTHINVSVFHPAKPAARRDAPAPGSLRAGCCSHARRQLQPRAFPATRGTTPMPLPSSWRPCWCHGCQCTGVQRAC